MDPQRHDSSGFGRRLNRWPAWFAGLLALATSLALAAPTGAQAAATSAGSTAATGGSRHDDEVLRAALQAVVDAGATGAIALVDDGDHQREMAVGSARLDPPESLRPVDQVRVGSITKTAMATITLQLVGEGRLSLHDSVEHWLPGEVPNGSAITIQMLLNHTSGIFNYTDDPQFVATVVAHPFRHWTPQELIAVANAHPPVFPPGQGWSYSNTNYILIGLVLEAVTGQPVQELVANRIVRPLHLLHTFFATSAPFPGPYAHGYLPPSLTGDSYLDVSAWSPSWYWAAGALVSNAADLARFYQALLSGRLLRPALLHRMITTVDTGNGFRYGLGIFTAPTPCGTIWGHDGSVLGYLSFAYNDRSGSRHAIVLVPTFADTAILEAVSQPLGVAICQMFDHEVPAAAAESGAATASPWLRLIDKTAALP